MNQFFRAVLEGPWQLTGLNNIDKNSSDAQAKRAAEIICPIVEKYVPPDDPFIENFCYYYE